MEKFPSSSGQLPVPVALNAELPTLFGLIIHDFTGFVNTYLKKLPQPAACGDLLIGNYPAKLILAPPLGELSKIFDF